MIPFLVIAAVAWWLAAPDPVTAGARTATGTGARAAGAGARAHWAAGRVQRRAGRNRRRDRWGGRVAGVKPHPWLLRADRAVTWSWGAAKTVAGVTGAAVRPVPSAVKAGWVQGRERHRDRAGSRPVPIAVDPPWWRQQPVPGQAPEQAGARCPWTVTPHALSLVGVQKACGRPVTDGVFCADHAAQSRRTLCVTCGETLGTDHTCSPVPAGVPIPAGTAPVQAAEQPQEQVPEQVEDTHGDKAPGQVQADDHTTAAVKAPFFDDAPDADGPTLDTEEEIRARHPALARISPEPLTIGERRFWTLRDRGYPGGLDQDGWPAPDVHTGAVVNPMPYLDQPAGTSPAGTIPSSTPTTEGAPVASFTTTANVPNVELNDLDSLRRFAEYIASLGEDSEFMQIVDRCKTLRESLREGGFGGHVDQAGASFEETAATLGQLGTEFCEEASQMAKLAANVAGG